MATTIDCPTCGRKLRLPEVVDAATVQCPTCSTTFSPASAAPAIAPVVDDAGRVQTGHERPLPLPPEPLPATLPARSLRACPYCREDIPRDATLCRFCGEQVGREDETLPPWEREGALRRDVESHRGGLILALGIGGMIASGIHVFSIIGVPVSVTAWIMATGDLRRMKANELDPRGTGLTQTGRICGIIGACMGLLWWVLGVLFLFTLMRF